MLIRLIDDRHERRARYSRQTTCGTNTNSERDKNALVVREEMEKKLYFIFLPSPHIIFEIYMYVSWSRARWAFFNKWVTKLKMERVKFVIDAFDLAWLWIRRGQICLVFEDEHYITSSNTIMEFLYPENIFLIAFLSKAYLIKFGASQI